MSTADYKPVLVRDSNLCFTDKLQYGVLKGAQNNTVQILAANTVSSSVISWNITLPSENTALNRRVLCESTITLMNDFFYAYPSAPADAFKFNWMSVIGAGANKPLKVNGSNVLVKAGAPNFVTVNGPSAYPFHSCLSTMQCTINNQTVSQQIADVLPFLTTVNDFENNLNEMCPHQRDTYFNMNDSMYGALNNPYGAYNQSSQQSTNNGAYDIEYYYIDVAGANVPVKITPQTVGDGNKSYKVLIKIRSTEPILMSPFIFNGCNDGAAMYGIQNLNFTFNVGSATRCFRSSIPNYATNAAVTAAPTTAASGTFGWVGSGFQYVSGINGYQPFASQLHLNYLTPFSSQMLTSRNVVPYMAINRFITNISNTQIPANSTNGAPMPEFQSTFQSVNLSSIPDKIALCVRLRKGLKTNQTADWNCVIKKVSISWNNSQGLLSSANMIDLYRMSREAGSNLNFLEYSGRSVQANTPFLYDTVGGTDPAGSNSAYIPTVGSVVILDLSKHIQLDSDWFAAGSLATTQLLITVTWAYQNTTVSLPADCLEGVLATFDSGILVNERGTTSTFVGILNKTEVLEVSASEEYFNDADIQRLVGGSFFGSLKSGLSSAWNSIKPIVNQLAPIAKTVMNQIPHPYAQQGAKVLEALGYSKHRQIGNGTSGGGMSGGGMNKRVN